MKSFLYRRFVLSSMILNMLVGTIAVASTPIEFLKKESERLRGILSDERTKTETRVKQFLEKSRDLFDFRELGRRTVEERLTTVAAKDIERFLTAFPRLIELSYLKNTEKYLRDYPLNFDDETIEGKDAKVTVKVKTKDKELLVVLYLYRTAKGWAIFNIVYDTVDLLQLYRKQFGKILTKSPFSGLCDKIDKKIKSLEKKGTAK